MLLSHRELLSPSPTAVEPLIAVQSVRGAVSESANTTVRVDGVSKEYDLGGTVTALEDVADEEMDTTVASGVLESIDESARIEGEIRFDGECPCDTDPLSLTSGKFVWVPVQVRPLQADLFE